MANVKIPNIELNFIMHIVILTMTTVATCVNGLSLRRDIPPESIPWLVIGSFAYIVSLIFCNLMILALPLVVNEVFWSLSPFMVAILVRIVVGETINVPTTIAITISISTVAVMAYLHRNEEQEETELLEY